jgi:hypothetical protein
VDGGESSGFGTAAQPKLGQEIAHVVTCRLFADEQTRSNLGVGQPLRDKPQHLDLAVAQELEILRTGPPLDAEIAEKCGGRICIWDCA